MSASIKFPPVAIALGALGSIFLAAGIYGLVSPIQTLLPILSQPAVGWSLAVIGGVLICAETVLVINAIRNR